MDRYDQKVFFLFSTSHPHSERSKPPKDAAGGHADTHAHHETHLDPVKARGLSSPMHGSLWHRHSPLKTIPS